MIETGFELLDVFIKTIYNYPLQSFVFLCMLVFTYKFFGNREISHDMWWGFKSWLTIDVRYAIPRLINNKDYSYCGIDVDMIDKVYSIIKTRYAYNWRQREIIKDELGLNDSQINQIFKALKNQNRIMSDGDYRLVTAQSQSFSTVSK